jgi:hypothetical protein
MSRLEKAKGRLQQSFPEIQHLIKTSNAVDVARKIIDPAQSIFRQFADDIQLKDLLAKAEALVARSDLAFAKSFSKDAPPAPAFRDTASSGESAKEAGVKKTPSRRARPKKAAPKKTLSKTKKKRAPRRKAKAHS